DPAAPGTATSRSGTLAQIQLQSGAIPSCVPPLGLDASNITATGAELTWLNSTSNPADGYQWEVRDDLDAVVASGSTLAGDITATASGLNAETDYNLYVRAVCGAGDTSTWAGPVPFTTPCAAVASFPHTE